MDHTIFFVCWIISCVPAFFIQLGKSDHSIFIQACHHLLDGDIVGGFIVLFFFLAFLLVWVLIPAFPIAWCAHWPLSFIYRKLFKN